MTLILNCQELEIFDKEKTAENERCQQESGIVPAYHDIPTATHSLIAADSAIYHHAFV